MKKPREVTNTSLFDQILSETSAEDKNFIANSLNIAHQIIAVMSQQGLKQKDLATRLGKTEAEISRWLSGSHNFTIRTISKIQTILGEQIVTTPKLIVDGFSDALDKVFISLKDQKTKVAFTVSDTVRTSYSTITKTAKIIPLSANFENAKFSYPGNFLTGTHS
ncbi:MAG: helix-turn-helix transcriptional regulator [Bacteroidota bacterium]